MEWALQFFGVHPEHAPCSHKSPVEDRILPIPAGSKGVM